MFKAMFDRFSKRADSMVKGAHEVPQSTRTRALLWCQEVFDAVLGEFWDETRRFLEYRHPDQIQLLRNEGTGAFLVRCNGEDFLDFIEDIFRVKCLSRAQKREQQMVEDLNDLLRVDGLPYHVTDFVKETVRETVEILPGMGLRETDVIKTVALPRVIMRESEVMHSDAIEPVLQLLQRPAYKSANKEYLDALEDYRKGDLGDSLTKCGSSFESFLKVLCDRKGWPYKSTDTAASLVKTVLAKGTLDSYFEQLLMIIATLRNRLSTSHGAGTGVRKVPRHVAMYALNATASAMLLLAAEAGES